MASDQLASDADEALLAATRAQTELNRGRADEVIGKESDPVIRFNRPELASLPIERFNDYHYSEANEEWPVDGYRTLDGEYTNEESAAQVKAWVDTAKHTLTSSFDAMQRLATEGIPDPEHLTHGQISDMYSALSAVYSGGTTRAFWEIGEGLGAFGSRLRINKPTGEDVTEFWRLMDKFDGNAKLVGEATGLTRQAIEKRAQHPLWQKPDPSAVAPDTTRALSDAYVDNEARMMLKDSRLDAPTPKQVKDFLLSKETMGGNVERMADDLGMTEAQIENRLKHPAWTEKGLENGARRLQHSETLRIQAAEEQMRAAGIHPSAIQKTLEKEFGVEAVARERARVIKAMGNES